MSCGTRPASHDRREWLGPVSGIAANRERPGSASGNAASERMQRRQSFALEVVA